VLYCEQQLLTDTTSQILLLGPFETANADDTE
jgi:hypothetical protein